MSDTPFDIFSQIPPQIVCIVQPVNGKGALYLGNFTSSYEHTLKDKNIDSVISVVKNHPAQFLRGKPSIKNHLNISVDDSPKQQIIPFFEDAYQFIEKNLQNSNILIHCFSGISRSSTILLSYLMKKNNWDYQKAYQEVYQAKRSINPNEGFIAQLHTWQLNQYQQLE